MILGNLHPLLTFMIGVLLGLFYFGLLWVTVRYVFGDRSHRPFPVLFFSFLVRMAITLAVLYVLLRDQWYNIIIALIGFFLARFVLERILSFPAGTSASPDSGKIGGHGD